MSEKREKEKKKKTEPLATPKGYGRGEKGVKKGGGEKARCSCRQHTFFLPLLLV